MVGQFAGKDIPAVGVSIGTWPPSIFMFKFVLHLSSSNWFTVHICAVWLI